MSRPKDADSAETIRRIVDAASALLEEGGTAQLSVRQVAARAGLSKGSVAYYYTTKEELLEACLDDLHRVQVEAFAEVVSDAEAETPIVDIAVSLVRRLYRSSVQQRTLMRLRIISLLERDGLPPNRRRQIHDPALKLGASLLAARTGRSLPEARVAIMGLMFSVARFAVLSEEDLLALTECESVEEAHEKVVGHLVQMARWVVAEPAAG